MPSPFPGMDPYLEAHWGDVHTRLIVYGSDYLRTKGQRHRRTSFVDNIRKSIR